MGSSTINFADTCYVSEIGSSTQVLCYSAVSSLYAISFITILVIGVIAGSIYLLQKKSYI